MCVFQVAGTLSYVKVIADLSYGRRRLPQQVQCHTPGVLANPAQVLRVLHFRDGQPCVAVFEGGIILSSSGHFPTGHKDDWRHHCIRYACPCAHVSRFVAEGVLILYSTRYGRARTPPRIETSMTERLPDHDHDHDHNHDPD